MATNPKFPTLVQLAHAQKSGFVFGGNQNEDQQMINRKKEALVLRVAERENFLRFCEENDFDVVLRNKEGRELTLRLSTDATDAIYGVINEELIEGLRQREMAIIAEMLRIEKDKTFDATKEGRVQSVYESAILALCTPVAMGSATLAAETPAIDPLPALPAGQRLFVTPPMRPAAPTV
jgi:hypothetical protein